MAKLVLTVALLVLLAHASSAYRTTITTVEVEDSSRESCRQKARMMDLSACEQVMRRSRYGALALEAEENPMDQKMRMCCNQLDKMSEDCQCEAVKYVMKEQMEQQMGREEMQKMRQRAMQIPMSCGISHCQMRSAFF